MTKKSFIPVRFFVLGALVVLALVSAVPAPLQAQATFRKYVSLGDSLASGQEAGCIVQRFQTHGYSAIIANRVGIADFQLPLISEKALSSPLTGTPCLGAVIVGQSISVGAISQEGTVTNSTLSRPYDDLGTRGFINTKDLVDFKLSVPGKSDKDNVIARVMRNFAGGPFEGKSAVDEALILNPDLVTLWIGPNDVLFPAATAVTIVNLGGAALSPLLTTTASFTDSYTRIFAGLKATGRTIVVANIPDVTSIPFFTRIPPFIINPATGLPISNGAGGFLTYIGQKHDGTAAAIPADTLVTLQAQSLLGQGIGIPTALGGTGLPLPDGSFVPPATVNPGVLLYKDEVDLLVQRTAEINAQIASIATANGAILVDVNGFFKRVKASGYEVAGIHLTADFLTGGLFSADGVHPTNIGYAILADNFIQAINAATGSSIPRPDFTDALFTQSRPVFSAAPNPLSSFFFDEVFTPEEWREQQIMNGLTPDEADPGPGPSGFGPTTRSVYVPSDSPHQAPQGRPQKKQTQKNN